MENRVVAGIRSSGGCYPRRSASTLWHIAMVDAVDIVDAVDAVDAVDVVDAVDAVDAVDLVDVVDALLSSSHPFIQSSIQTPQS